MAEYKNIPSSQLSPALNPKVTSTDNHSPTKGVTVAAPEPKPKAKSGPPEHKDGLREIIETIVFVVVLVLLLKSYAAEAFVIPTGSMATTLYGYQKDVTCPQCGYDFPVN